MPLPGRHPAVEVRDGRESGCFALGWLGLDPAEVFTYGSERGEPECGAIAPMNGGIPGLPWPWSTQVTPDVRCSRGKIARRPVCWASACAALTCLVPGIALGQGRWASRTNSCPAMWYTLLVLHDQDDLAEPATAMAEELWSALNKIVFRPYCW